MKNFKPLLLGLLVVGTATFAQQKKNAGPAKAPNAPSATEVAPTTAPVKPTLALAIPEKITSVEGITEYKLGNGLRVLMFPDQSKQTITVNITYLVGSRHEGYGETGMAHLLEHLVFKGSPKHKDIPTELTSHGARPNGTTWLDRTNYFETFAATQENLDWALDLEADRMVNSFIAKKDLESEMTVVRNEFESGENDPESILQERVTSTAYLWHNYGNSTIGARSDIEKVPIENLQAFYHKYYQPDNAVLLVAGKFDEEKVLKQINEKFGVIPRPTRELTVTHTDEPTQDGERQVTLRRTGDVQVVAAAYHMPSGLHADFVACDMLVDLLADKPSGRLYKALIDTKKASDQSGVIYATKDPTLALFSVQVLKEKSLDSAKTIMLDVIENFVKTTPTQEDVDRIRNKSLKNIELLLNSSERVGLGLSEYTAMGDWRMLFFLRDQYKKVTPEDIRRVARAYLKESNRTLGIFVPTVKPERSEVPEAKTPAEILKDFKGGQTLAQGEAFDPSVTNIDARTTKLDIGGVKTAFLGKKTRGNSVQMRLTLRFGDEKSLFGKTTAGGFVGQMLNKGTSHHTRQQIQDELDKMKARMNVGGSASQANVTIETNRDNLPAVIKLMAEILKEPTFPADELDKLKLESLAQIEAQRSEPQAKVIEAMSQMLNVYPKGDVRYSPTMDEQVADTKAVKIEEVKQFYKDFYGASNATLSIVGDFDDKVIKDSLTKYLATWRSPKPFTRIQSPFNEIKPQNKSIETPDKANSFFIACQPLKLNENDPEYPALLLGNFMLGGGFINSRLATRIRQKEGISYGVGSQLQASPLDNSGMFLTYAIYAPENAARLESAFKEEIDRMLKEGFTDKEIEDAKKGYLQSRQVSRSQDNELSNKLNTNTYLGRTMAWDGSLDEKLKALTADQIKAAMQKFIDPTKISILKGGDFEGAAKKKNANAGSVEVPKK